MNLKWRLRVKELISVMIPAYNAEKYIGRCLESLKNQTYSNIEIVIVNDGSKDNTQLICEEYVNKDSRFRLINQKNGGEGAARNKGLSEAKGKYLCFVDADDYVYPDFIENMYSMHNKYNAELVICGFTELKGAEVLNETSGDIQVMNQEQSMASLLLETSFKGYVWNKMFDLDIIRKKKLHFDETLAVWTDVLFVFQYMLNIKTTIFNPEPKYYYIYIENSASHLANHLLGVEKSYSAIRAKEQMVDFIPKQYDSVNKQLSVRFVQSSLSVIRNIGYVANGKKDYKDYYKKCLEYIKEYRAVAVSDLSKKDKILSMICLVWPNLLMMMYKFVKKNK